MTVSDDVGVKLSVSEGVAEFLDRVLVRGVPEKLCWFDMDTD